MLNLNSLPIRSWGHGTECHHKACKFGEFLPGQYKCMEGGGEEGGLLQGLA